MTLDSTTITPSTARTDPKSGPGSPLKAADLLKHPAFSSNDWSARIPPTSSGKVRINTSTSHARPGGPIDIAYELHGHGPTKLIWIMGLGAFHTAWKRQSKYFGHDAERAEKYTCLVFDNRGVGESGKPWCRYSTREMAGDVVELLGGLGWLDEQTVQQTMDGFYRKQKATTGSPGDSNKQQAQQQKHDLVIAGVSMGGMIAQELALLLPPPRIQALILISTCPRLTRTVPFIENLRQRINMFIPKDVDVQLEEIAHRLFSRDFLEAKDSENEDETRNFPTNRDRFAASELAKRMDKEGFTRVGFLAQAVAAGWHAKSREELGEILRRVGARRVLVIHGTEDRMIDYKHFEMFREEFGVDSGVEFRSWEGSGHVLPWEQEREFNEVVEKFIERTAVI